MKHPLRRVLELRALIEERSQQELERRGAEIRRLVKAAAVDRAAARAARADALRCLASGGAEWQVERADAEILAGRSAQLGSLAAARQPAAEAARAALLERRMERRQVETLMSEATAEAAREEARLEQKRVDDWFQSRALWEKPGR